MYCHKKQFHTQKIQIRTVWEFWFLDFRPWKSLNFRGFGGVFSNHLFFSNCVLKYSRTAYLFFQNNLRKKSLVPSPFITWQINLKEGIWGQISCCLNLSYFPKFKKIILFILYLSLKLSFFLCLSALFASKLGYCFYNNRKRIKTSEWWEEVLLN